MPTTPPVNPVPFSVTVKPPPPRVCDAGEIDVIVGPTVNCTELDVPSDVETVTFLGPFTAADVIVNVAVI